MKYSVEQKARIRGMDSFISLKYKIAGHYKIAQNAFKIEGDFIIIESKMNKKTRK